MKTYVLVTDKQWHNDLFDSLKKSLPGHWIRMKTKEEFQYVNLVAVDPDKIFIPHWSYFIPEEVFNRFECIVFHMTDLPYGRGGSPLQNLIDLGFEETKVSALRVVRELDAGPIYNKKKMSLLGTAEEIFIRSAQVVNELIIEIVQKKIVPSEQTGSPVTFKRRKREEGDISKLAILRKVYDYIRMLDADSYPSAFLETDHFRFEFSRATLKSNEIILADVRITKK